MSKDTTGEEGGRLLAAASGSTIATSEDEDAAYEQWMEELAETCQADLRPCAGCQQGGICDGWTNDQAQRPGGKPGVERKGNDE